MRWSLPPLLVPARLLLALALALLAPAAVRAGAWPQAEDGGFITFPLALYEARTQGFDRRGLPNGFGRQRSLEFGPYWEHGLTPRWTVGLQPRLTAIWMNEPGNHNRNFGLAETQAFVRYNLYRGDRDVFSVQGLVGIPGVAQRDRNPSLAEPNATYEIRALYGRSFPLGNGVNAFIDAQVAYRYRAGPAADVLFLKNTIGVRPWAEWAFWVQSITDLGLRNGRFGGADYAVQRLTATAVWDFSPHSSIELTYLREVASRHVPRGQGAVLAYWYRY